MCTKILVAAKRIKLEFTPYPEINLNDLHSDIIYHVLSYLNITDILACKNAIPQWDGAIQYYAKLNYHKLAFTRDTMRKYCNSSTSLFSQYLNVLKQFGSFVTDLTTDYSVFSEFVEPADINEAILQHCVNLKALHLKNSRAEVYKYDDGFILEQLKTCINKLEKLSIDGLWTSGRCLIEGPNLKCLELGRNEALKMDYIYKFLETNEHLEKLSFYTSQICDFDKICRHIKKIQTLRIQALGIHTQNISPIASLEHLTSLDLNVYDPVGMEYLIVNMASKHLLEHLGLHLYHAMQTGTVICLSQYTCLKSLRLVAGPLCFGPISTDTILQCITADLIHLELKTQYCSINKLCSMYPNLESLQLTARPSKDVLQIGTLTKLRNLHLELSTNSSMWTDDLLDDIGPLIVSLGKNNKLESLSLWTLQPIDCATYQVLAKTTKLKKLVIRHCVAWDAVCEMISIPSLEYFSCALGYGIRNQNDFERLQNGILKVSNLRELKLFRYGINAEEHTAKLLSTRPDLNITLKN